MFDFAKSGKFPAIAGILAFSVTALAFWTAISYQMNGILEEEIEDLIGQINEEYADSELAFETLAGVQSASCTPEIETLMRKALFDGHEARDIFFMPEGSRTVECSVTAGLLAEPVELPALPGSDEGGDGATPDGVEHWFGLDLAFLDSETPVEVERRGHFAVVLSPFGNIEEEDEPFWQVYASDPDGNFVADAYGLKNLASDRQSAQYNPVTAFLYSASCTTDYANYCIVIAADLEDFVEDNVVLLGLGLVISTGLGTIAYRRARDRVARRMSPEGRVIHAIKSGGRGLKCVYQPITDLRTGQAVGCEVLARFEDETGKLFPDQFIPIVENAKLTWEFTEIMLGKALDELDHLTDLYPGFRVSVNFFLIDLQDRNLSRIKKSTGVQRALSGKVSLNWELLETGIDEPSDMNDTLEYLRGEGFSLAIDDFGTGYSNLAQVRSIQADYLKIDKSFIHDIGMTGQSVKASLVPHILEIANLIKINVIAEGIETKSQAEALRDLGVPFGQGYYYSRPVPLHQFAAYLELQELGGVA